MNTVYCYLGMIRKILKPFILMGITLFLLALLLPNISYTDWTTIVFAAIVFTLVNKVVKPIIKLLTLPINFLTLGLFSVLVNAGLLMLCLWLVPGFVIEPMTLFGVSFGKFMTLIITSALIGLTQSAVSIVL